MDEIKPPAELHAGKPRRLPLQFTLRAMLLSMAVVAITLGGYGYVAGGEEWDWEDWMILPLYGILLPNLWFWVPPIFIAFAVGRKQLTPWMVVGFATCQAAAVGLLPLLNWLESFVEFGGVPPVAGP